MVEIMEAIGSTFLNWRTRATKGVRWAWNRRSKTESMTKPENPQDHDRRNSNFARLSLSIPSPELDDTYDQINASDTQEDLVQPTYPSASDPSETSQPSLDNQKFHERHDNTLQKHITTSTGSKGATFGDDRRSELLNLYGGFKDISATRVRLRQSRMALKYKRDEEVELRVKFMKHLNVFFADLNHPEAESLRREYELLQIATEEYLTMENSYRQEENQMEEREYMLDLSMEGFAGPSEREPAPNLEPYTEVWSQVSDEDSIHEIPRCVSNYLSRLGDERMFQERLSELESEWFMIIERRDMRHQFQLPLDEDSQEFLLTFDDQRDEIWKDLNNAQMDVNYLRVFCVDQGHRNYRYEDISSLNLYQYAEQPSLEVDMDPLKISMDEKYLYFRETEISDQDDDHLEPNWETPQMSPNRRFQILQILQQNGRFSSSEFINRWMLHQLRISSMGIRYIHRLPTWRPLREKGWQDHDISQHVLDGWFSDEAALASTSSDSYLDDSDTVAAHVYGREERLKSPSAPSLPRTSAPKLRQRRHSRP